MNLYISVAEQFKDNLEEECQAIKKALARHEFPNVMLFTKDNKVLNLNSYSYSYLDQLKSEILISKKETQKIDQKINGFFDLLRTEEKSSIPMGILGYLVEKQEKENLRLKILISEILEIQEKKQELTNLYNKIRKNSTSHHVDVAFDKH